jgi:uncharacterized protein (TIGR02301 family)
MRLSHLATLLALPLLAAGGLAASASAQEQPTPAAATPSDPNHWATVMQLAEVLGQVHWVRVLCNGDQDETWRRYMQDLLELEGRSGGQHTALVGAFNNGYRAGRTSYHDCNAEMRAVESRLAGRGRTLAEQLARSYLD